MIDKTKNDKTMNSEDKTTDTQVHDVDLIRGYLYSDHPLWEQLRYTVKVPSSLLTATARSRDIMLRKGLITDEVVPHWILKETDGIFLNEDTKVISFCKTERKTNIWTVVPQEDSLL